MPLRDHFHGSFADHPSWEAVHTRWAVAIADDLNRRLPNRLVAEAPMHLGSRVSADVAEYERLNGHGHAGNGSATARSNGGAVGVAVAPATATATESELETYVPPDTDLAMPAVFPAEIKVEVRDRGAAYRLLAVVELVSPSNKKEQDAREQFVAKCLSYLGKGIGLVVIDTVTERLWNLHNELVRIGHKGDKFLMRDGPPIYVTAYRPVHRNKEDLIDLWLWPLKLGEALPAVPLALKGYGCVRLDLEATYAEACARLRIPE